MRVLPGAGVPAHNHRLLAQRLQGAIPARSSVHPSTQPYIHHASLHPSTHSPINPSSINPSMTAFSKPSSLASLALSLSLSLSLCPPELPAAVVPSQGVHLPGLPPRPGQRLHYDPEHHASAAARPVLSRLQQRPMRPDVPPPGLPIPSTPTPPVPPPRTPTRRIRTNTCTQSVCSAYTVEYLEFHFPEKGKKREKKKKNEKPCTHTHTRTYCTQPQGQMYIAYIQPSMYKIIHTQTTSVGTDLIC